MPAPLVLASLAAGAAPGIGTAIGAQSPAARAYRKDLRSEAEKLRQGKLGMSDAEKRSMLAGQMRAIQASTRGTEDQLRRDAAAAGGFGASGAQMAGLQALAAQQAESGAQAAGRIDEESTQLAQQRAADIRARLERQKEQVKADWSAALGGVGKGALSGAIAKQEGATPDKAAEAISRIYAAGGF